MLVWIPGTGGKPSNVSAFLEVAARHGYLAVSLDYPDHDSVSTCKNDAPCYEQMGEELLDGVDTSKHVEIAPADSITNRLAKLLAHL